MDARFESIMSKVNGKTQGKIGKSLENLSLRELMDLIFHFNCSVIGITKAVCKYKGVKYASPDTSQAAYQLAKTNLSKKQKRIMETIWLLGRACNDQIASYLRQPINRICPRVKELRDMKPPKIIDDGVRLGPYGRLVHFWRVAETQKYLFEN